MGPEVSDFSYCYPQCCQEQDPFWVSLRRTNLLHSTQMAIRINTSPLNSSRRTDKGHSKHLITLTEEYKVKWSLQVVVEKLLGGGGIGKERNWVTSKIWSHFDITSGTRHRAHAAGLREVIGHVKTAFSAQMTVLCSIFFFCCLFIGVHF